MITCGRNVKPMPTPLDVRRFVIDRAVMAYKETETDVLYGVAIDRAVMAYKGTETDVLYGVEWRGELTPLLTRGFTF
jgi:hypothetical protein